MNEEELLHRAFGIIRQIPLFADLADEEFNAFKHCASARSFESHGLVCRTGDESNGAFILVEGEVAEQWADGIVIHDRPGTLLEATALLSEHPHEHTLVARTDVLMIEVSRKHFMKMFHKQQAAAYEILYEISQLLAHEIRDLNRCLNDLVQTGPGEPRG